MRLLLLRLFVTLAAIACSEGDGEAPATGTPSAEATQPGQSTAPSTFTPIPTSKLAPTSDPAPTPVRAATATRAPGATAVASPVSEPKPTATAMVPPGPEPTAAAVGAEAPTATAVASSVPDPQPTATAVGVEAPTATAVTAPGPTPKPTATAVGVEAPTATAVASPVPVPQPQPTATAVVRPPFSPLRTMDVERIFPNVDLRQPVVLTYAADGSARLFVALQPGEIVVFPGEQNAASALTFLDITGWVNDRGFEEGLLGLAFDPSYSASGYFYVYYSASGPRRSVISRFSVSGDSPNTADPSSEVILLQVPQPYSNHNGGQLVFGPDGYLYIGLGDGGDGGDPQENGQNRSTLLGSIIRIDVGSIDSVGGYAIPPDNPFAGDGGGVRQEIWAYGLRNPWRFTFDRKTGNLWAADVGQDRYEEVDVIRPGLNYGWNRMEGFHCFPQGGFECDQSGLELPIAEYGREGGCSITGGYVYRGSRLPSLYGAYVYGDFCSGKIWALRYDGTQVTEQLELVDSRLSISSFGEDQSGELYILSFDDKIYRLVPR